MSFKKTQYDRVQTLIATSNIFNGDAGFGKFKGNPYPFVLNNENNNLITQSRNDILAYFTKNRIVWWNGRLTNHTLSSQVACLNHLFPIRADRNAVLSLVKEICPEIIDVLQITSDKEASAYIQFEAVSDYDHLNEGTLTRGSNCTSIDALIYGVHKDGRKILFPIEWKYVEAYGNEDKSLSVRGATRKARYTNLINQSAQLQSSNHSVYYYEPFYQLMRQTLWAEQIIAHKDNETIKVDDYIHIHVIPAGNVELLNKKYLISGMGMKDTWLANLKDQSKYVIINPKDLFKSVDVKQHSTLIDYLEKRYW